MSREQERHVDRVSTLQVVPDVSVRVAPKLRGEQQLEGRSHPSKAGYVMVRAPTHPRSGRSRYVFERILVVEEILGRHLVNGESAHHINGVRDNNGPENLELWTRPQPSGLRVIDTIAWARENLDRYVGTGTPPGMLTPSLEDPWSWGGIIRTP